MLALVTDAFGGHGGIAQYNRGFLSALADSDAVASVTVVPRQATGRVKTPSRIRQTPAYRGRIAFTLAALHASLFRQIDVVFCGHLYMAPLAFLIARLKGAKLVMQAHGVEAWPRPAPWIRAAVESADLILGVSRHTRRTLLGWAAIAPERVLVLPNSITADFTPGDGADLRKAWGLDGKRVLLSVGRMSARERYKGHDRVIAALTPLLKSGHDAIYVIIGDGDDRPRLQAMVEREGLADRVRFMGEIDRRTLVDAYRLADLFVMPSTGEGFGIAFLEAMACGTPALGLAIAGALDPLSDGVLGRAVTEQEWLAALDEALNRPKAQPDAQVAAVQNRFGRARFAEGAGTVWSRLNEAPQP